MPWDDEEQREISRRRWFIKHWFGRPYIVSNPEVDIEEPRREIRESRVPVRLGNREYIWRNYEVSPEVGEGIRDYIKTSFRMAGERMKDPVYAALAFGPGTIKEVAPIGKGVAGGKDVVGGAGRGGAVGNLSRTEFDDWFRGSKVTQEHGFRAEYWRNKGYGRDVPPPGKTGTPKVMTHVTRSEFETFDTMGSRQLGSHFAPDVVTSGMMKGQEEGVRKVKAYLNIKNPLRIPDIEDFSASRVLRQAQKQGVFTAQEADEIAGYLKISGSNRVANTILINELEDKGFDGLVYLNRREVAMHGGGSPYDWVRKYRPDLSGARPEPHIQSPLARFMDEVSDEWWYEHIPSDDSYVAFRPEQIKVVK